MRVPIRFHWGTALACSIISLLIVSCRSSNDTALQKVDLGPEVGTLELSLDTNFSSLEHWIHRSDHTCGKTLVWGGAHSTWPIAKDTAYITTPPDSLFLFTVRLFPEAPLECDSAVDVHQWLTSRLTGLRSENPTIDIAAQGTMTFLGTEWAFIQAHFNLSLQNDRFEVFTEQNGRGISMLWQRIATSPVEFDFGAYCRRQFETSRITLP